MSTETEKKEKPGCLYHLFKAYVRFLHNKIFYKKTYQINTEAVPADGTPCLIVSNHQNCMNDPLGLVTSMTDRKLNVITRADVFMVSPVANKFLRSIGLLPAFRLDYEGEKALDTSTNSSTDTGPLTDTGHSSRKITTSHSIQGNTRGACFSATRARITQKMTMEPVMVMFRIAVKRFCRSIFTACFRQ